MANPPLDVEASNRLASQLSLVYVGFLHVEGRYLGSPPKPESRLSWELADPPATWSILGQFLFVVLSLEVTLSAQSEDQDPRRMARVAATLRIQYELNADEWNLDDVPHAAGINGLMQSWSYFRAEVQHLTTKIGLPPLLLPPLVPAQAARIAKPKKLESDPDSSPPTRRRAHKAAKTKSRSKKKKGARKKAVVATSSSSKKKVASRTRKKSVR